MLPATQDCVFEAINLLEPHLADQVPATVVVLDLDDRHLILTTLSYWAEGEAQVFERDAAWTAVQAGARRGVLGTPLIVHEGGLEYGSPLEDPIPDGFSEWLWVFAFDLEEGYHLTRTPIIRTPEGPALGETQILVGDTTVDAETPGFTLMSQLLNTMED